VTAELIRADDPDFTFKATWDMAKAQRAKLTGKAVWQQYPEQMLRSRAITEVCRQGAGDALYGVIYSPEEIEREAPNPQASQAQQPPAPHVPDFPEISACTDVEQLRAWWQHSPADVRQVIEARVSDLQTVDAEVVDADTGEVQAAFPEGDQ
jgi:hypothetical protein